MRSIALAVLALAALTGCTTWQGPTEIAIPDGDYGRSMQTAVDTLNRLGYRCAVIDREAGVVDTDPLRAGSLVEPWRTDNASLSDAAANTVSARRRQVRLSWTPVGAEDLLVEPSTLGGPELPGSTAPRARVELGKGPLILRAIVSLEQQYTPGDRISPYSASLSSTFKEPRSATEGPVDRGTWTPVGRDEATEQRILGLIERALGPTSDPGPKIP
ncbi:MAG: hypothetical protein FJ270_09000 [Planctomycetes bacterium]|nr:hypothetical protein [Planctomycetota bacterium]